MRIGLVLSTTLALTLPAAAAAQPTPQPGMFICPQHGQISCGGQGSDACNRAFRAHQCSVHGDCSGTADQAQSGGTLRPPRNLTEAYLRGLGFGGGLGALLGSLNYETDPAYVTVGGVGGAAAGVALVTLVNANQLSPAEAAIALTVAGAAGGYAYSHYRYLSEDAEDTRARDALIGAAAGAALGIPLGMSNRSPVERPRSIEPRRRTSIITTARFVGVVIRW